MKFSLLFILFYFILIKKKQKNRGTNRHFREFWVKMASDPDKKSFLPSSSIRTPVAGDVAVGHSVSPFFSWRHPFSPLPSILLSLFLFFLSPSNPPYPFFLSSNSCCYSLPASDVMPSGPLMARLLSLRGLAFLSFLWIRLLFLVSIRVL